MDYNPKFSNHFIAKMLRDIASAYEADDESYFKIRAYRLAAESIEKLPGELKDMWEENRLEEIPGVGKAIAGHLAEYFKTGKVKHFDYVKNKLPTALFNLIEIPGIGPKTAYKLSLALKIENREDLIKACQKGLVAKLSGFGEKSQDDILKSALSERPKKDRLLLSTGLEIAEKYIAYLKTDPIIIQAHPLGSLRRRASTVGDIDISICSNDVIKAIDKFIRYPEIVKVLNKGDKKASVLLKSGQRVDLMVAEEARYGSLLQHFTGSKEHNIELRTYAQNLGYSVSEYGIKTKRGFREFKTEEELYTFLHLSYIQPELREGAGEIELAKNGELFKLIELSSIRGDLQNHSIYSDGENTIFEMAESARAQGYDYFGITDHSPSLETHTKEQVIALIKKQKKEVLDFNQRNKGFKLFLGTECNILASSKLTLPNDILELYDYVVASIHTSFNQPEDMITQRLITAIENPFVNFIAHPTGRLINQREPYNVDWDLVFTACLKYNKPLEINAFPTRLDLPDVLIKRAKDLGLKFIINTDSHERSQLNNMKYGVYVARRGWLSKNEVLNTNSLEMLIKLLKIRNQNS